MKMSWMPWTEGELMISYGKKGTAGQYARKLLHYAYFDRQERGILLMRQDITTEYLSSAGRRSASATPSFMQGLILLQACITARQ